MQHYKVSHLLESTKLNQTMSSNIELSVFLQIDFYFSVFISLDDLNDFETLIQRTFEEDSDRTVQF